MQYFLPLVTVCLLIELSVAPPVNQKKEDDANKENEVDQTADVMEYNRYLTEVIQALESDPEFRAKLMNADQADVRTGKIADELEFVNHKVRSKLDELKREELERLRHLATKENQLANGLDVDHMKIHEHLDHTNTRTFEIQDLKKLIAKTTKDLAKADQKRREEFKQHEMQKKYEEQEKLKTMDEGERKKYEEELQALNAKRKEHEPVHHPGSKQQLEEVWEKQDHMESEEFNPRTFFFLHDLDGNGVWDQDEVKILFLKELDKLYAEGTPQADILKRAEEMERMREHVFNEADLDKDGLISYEEFLEQTKKPDFQQDEGWEGLDQQQIYTKEEFEAFERYKQEELQKMIAKGMLPPHPGNIPAHHEPFPPQHANVPVAQGIVPPPEHVQGQNHQQYDHQQAMPQQQYQNHMPVQPVHGQIPQQQYNPQLSQHNQFQGQMQGQQYQQGQMPQQHYQDSLNQQQHPVQVPIQQQVPVQQAHAQAAPSPQHQQIPANQAQHGVENNALPQQNIQSQHQQQLNPQPIHANAQHEVHMNKV